MTRRSGSQCFVSNEAVEGIAGSPSVVDAPVGREFLIEFFGGNGCGSINALNLTSGPNTASAAHRKDNG